MTTSIKQYELLEIRYMFHKYMPGILNEPKWRHFKFYATEQGVKDAIIAHRKTSKYEYPGEWNETKYPHIRPCYVLSRYKWIKRNL